MNLPIIYYEEGDKYWEYDGFLVKKQNRIFWMFEKRQIDRNDHFYFITDTGKPFTSPDGGEKQFRTMSGRYLTAGQDEFQSVVSNSILLQRVNVSGDEAIRAFMHGSAEVVAGEKAAALKAFKQEFHQSPLLR